MPGHIDPETKKIEELSRKESFFFAKGTKNGIFVNPVKTYHNARIIP
jgi:hypothetical protein